ncbi:MAG: hypothetical protein V4642_03465 [Bacteroidota bacterium]
MKKKLFYISLVILILFFQPAFQRPPIEIQIPILKFIIQFSFYLALATLSVITVLIIPEKISEKSFQIFAVIPVIPFFFFALFGLIFSTFSSNSFYKDQYSYINAVTNEKYIDQYNDQGALGGTSRLIHAQEILGDKIRWFNNVNSQNLPKGKWYVFENDSLKDSILVH